MATIDQDLTAIRNAIYGKDVREAIADGIEHCYDDVTTSKTTADSAADRANTAAARSEEINSELGDAADAIVLVQEEQPTEELNKIWVKPTSDEYSIPTFEEHEELWNTLSQANGIEMAPFVNNKYIPTNKAVGEIVDLTDIRPSNSVNYGYAIFDCTAGDCFFLNTHGSSTPRAWAFLDSNDAVIGRADARADTTNEYMIAPEGSAKLVIHQWADAVSYKGIPTIDTIGHLNNISKNAMNGVNEVTGVSIGGWIGGYWKTPQDGSPVEYVPDPQMVCSKIAIEDSTIVEIYGTGGTEDKRLYVYIDENGNAFGRSAENANGKFVMNIPDEAVYLCVNNVVNVNPNGYYAYLHKNNYLSIEVQNNLQNTGLYRPINKMQFTPGIYWSSAGSFYILDSNKTWGLTQMITVYPGDSIFVNTPPQDDNGVELGFGINEFRKRSFIRTVNPNYGDVVVIPEGIDSINITFGRSRSTHVVVTQEDFRTYAKAYIIRKQHCVLDGKRVSMIGASDMTFKGYIPSENVAYYKDSNYDVYSVGDCWWHIGITENGGLPLINDSWSGSTVADGVRTPTSSNAYVPFIDSSRCQNLHAYQHGGTSSDTLVTASNIDSLRHSPWDDDQSEWVIGEYVKEIDPDVVIINGGGNDYIHNCPMGTYDGHTTLSSDDVSTFREAYANLINKIQSRYPYALVICDIPIYLVKPNMSNPPTDSNRNQVNCNSLGLTYKDYHDAIREIAALKGCPVIDNFTHGFSRYNYYNLFCSDSEIGPVHPNALGHMVIGKDFAKNLANCVTGFIDFV